jgi:hypothetical protein
VGNEGDHPEAEDSAAEDTEDQPSAQEESPDSTPPVAPPVSVPDRILSKVPPTQREELREEISEFIASASWTGPAPHPLANKVTPEHVGQMLQLQGRGMELEANDRNNGRWFLFALAILVVALIVFLALANKDEILDDVIRLGIAFVGGFSGGYGVAIARRRD